MAEQSKLSHAEQNAAGWLETIREHVACLDADRERLEELRDEREALADAAKTEALLAYGTVQAEDTDEEEKAEELDTEATEAQAALKEWDEENAEELAELEAAVKIEGEEIDADSCRERIQESPLSVEVRSGWHAPGAAPEAPEEFMILLSTGGPALRIMGDLDEHGQPTRAYLQYQDWGTPWTDYSEGSGEILLRWASVFYFGE